VNSYFFLSMLWNRVGFTHQFMLLLVPRACCAAALVCWLMLGVHVVVSHRRGESREKVFAHFSAPP
jgi:hypothetical protein